MNKPFASKPLYISWALPTYIADIKRRDPKVGRFFEIAIKISLERDCGGNYGVGGQRGPIFDRIAFLSNPDNVLNGTRLGVCLKDKLKTAFVINGLLEVKNTLCYEIAITYSAAMRPWTPDKWTGDQFVAFREQIMEINDEMLK